jgi:hypothetical protein
VERYDKDGNKDGLRPIDTFAISEVQKEPSGDDTPAISFCNIDEDEIAVRLSVDGTYGTHSMSIRTPGAPFDGQEISDKFSLQAAALMAFIHGENTIDLELQVAGVPIEKAEG